MLTNCHLLLQGIGEAVLMLDKDGYIKYCNETATALTGYNESELLNQSISLLYNPKGDPIKSEYELSLALKKGKFISEGWKFQKGGERFWAELTISAIYDEQKQFSGFSCLLRDTYEKKKDELELRERGELFRLMVDGVKDYAIFLLDPKGFIVTWNEGARRLKGYAPNEIIGKHFSTFYTLEDLKNEKPKRELEIAIATGKYEEEGWRVKKNGSVFWANVVITSLYNELNQHIGFSKVTRDLTEKKEADEHLRQSEERYRSLVAQVTDYGIFMLDEAGRIISWNEGARKMKGYSEAEILGKYFTIFYPEEDILNGKPSYELKVARAEGKYEEEGWRLRKDGSRFWANVVITAIYNPDGSLIGYSKVTRDLTERKAGERALRESYDRYRKLADELKETNASLTYANEELEQFTSIVSHDLQEPIRTIKSFLTLIEMKMGKGGQEDLKTYITKSINAANRMKELIQNLLQYSQLSRGDLMEEKVNVDDLLQQALQNLKSAIEASKARIIIENRVKSLVGDRIQLLQLIQNLLSNALKFTDKNDPQIHITSAMEEDAVRFSISDNGIGIAKGDLEKVFEIFRRLNTKKEYPGTGIGLAICKKIVDRHGGRLWLESEPGVGTTFHFTLHQKTPESIVTHEKV